MWRGMREAQLRKEPLCRHCLTEGKATPATQADHIVAHRGEWERFIDPYNLQSLCASCHSLKTYHEDGALGRERKGRGG